MAVYLTTAAPDNTSTATFRAWGQAISGVFPVAGWVQTADTGQINWTTVTVPAGANTVAGKELWRMNDSLQGTSPVILMIEYMTGGAAAWPQIRLSMGTTTDGAGNLTGVQKVGTSVSVTSANTTVAQTVSGAGGPSWINIEAMSGSYSTASGIGFLVERFKNAAGNDMDGGAILIVPNGSSMQQWVLTMPTLGPPPGGQNALGCPMPFNTGSGANGLDVTFSPHIPFYFTPLNPIIGVLGCFGGDVSGDQEVTVDMYGVPHTYRRSRVNAHRQMSFGTLSPVASYHTYLLRYE